MILYILKFWNLILTSKSQYFRFIDISKFHINIFVKKIQHFFMFVPLGWLKVWYWQVPNFDIWYRTLPSEAIWLWGIARRISQKQSEAVVFDLTYRPHICCIFVFICPTLSNNDIWIPVLTVTWQMELYIEYLLSNGV